MHYTWVLITCGLVGLLATTTTTAEKPPEEYAKAMRDIRAAMENVDKALKAVDFEAVTKNAAIVEDAFLLVEKYWTGKAEDALKWSQAAGKAASDLGSAASMASGDGIAFSAKELAAMCTACHEAHRERLPDGSFQIK